MSSNNTFIMTKDMYEQIMQRIAYLESMVNLNERNDCDDLNDSRDFDICSVFMCKESA